MTTNDIPYGLAYCFATEEQCARCAKRSHSIAARIPTDNLQPVKCIHPLYIDKMAEGQAFEYYSEQQTVRLAHGFVHTFDDVPFSPASRHRERSEIRPL